MTKLSDLSHADLIAKANELSRKWWGVDYTGTIELVNRKWRRRHACFIHHRTRKDIQIIRMSKPANDKRTEDEVYGSLLHELVHWRLYTLDLPCSDEDREFVEECVRVGAPFSQTQAAQFAAKKYGRRAV
jgi:hypothetical protein